MVDPEVRARLLIDRIGACCHMLEDLVERDGALTKPERAVGCKRKRTDGRTPRSLTGRRIGPNIVVAGGPGGQ